VGHQPNVWHMACLTTSAVNVDTPNTRADNDGLCGAAQCLYTTLVLGLEPTELPSWSNMN